MVLQLTMISQKQTVSMTLIFWLPCLANDFYSQRASYAERAPKGDQPHACYNESFPPLWEHQHISQTKYLGKHFLQMWQNISNIYSDHLRYITWHISCEHTEMIT